MSKYIAEVGYIHAFSCSRKIKLKIEAHCQIEIIKWHPCGIHLDYILRILVPLCTLLHLSSLRGFPEKAFASKPALVSSLHCL